MFDLKGSHRLLVIAPHPDDEVIGCAGLIQKIKQSGGKVYVLFLTVGDTKDFTKTGSSSLKERKNEIKKVSSFLKYDDYDIAFEGKDHHLKLDNLGQKELMDAVERKSKVSLEKIRPSIVVFPSFYSYNQDHRAAAYAAHASLRPAEKNLKHFVPNVLSYEEAADLWSLENKYTPNVFISLSRGEIDNKLKAVGMYSSQARPFPNLRSLQTLKALSVLRGSQTGSEHAEAYTVHRITV